MRLINEQTFQNLITIGRRGGNASSDKQSAVISAIPLTCFECGRVDGRRRAELSYQLSLYRRRGMKTAVSSAADDSLDSRKAFRLRSLDNEIN